MTERKTAALDGESLSTKIDFAKSFDTSNLNGKSVLITGGASGIARGLSMAFAAAGAYVTIADLNETAGQATVAELTGKGLKVQFVKTDVTSWQDLVTAFKSAVAFSPDDTIDIVIPAAGIGGTDTAARLQNVKTTPEGDPLEPAPTKVIHVNLLGVYHTVELSLFYFKNHPGQATEKQIIFIASLGAYSSMHGIADYAASKWAVRGIFRALRGSDTILGTDKPKLRCNMTAPNFTRTAMTATFAADLEARGITLAGISDCVDVIMRMCADQSIKGRAVAIAANGNSFDLCDDEEGLDGGREMALSRTENRFGVVKTAH